MTAVLLERPSLRRPPDWATRGACVGRTAPDLDPWSAPSDDDLPRDVRARLAGIAKDVCWGTCTVREACLEWALATGEGSGIWGGLDPAERRALAAERGLRRPSIHGASQHGTNGGYQTCAAGVGGQRCDRCKAAHAAAVGRWRERRRWASPATRGLTVVVHELHVPTGRGRVKAYPGQMFLALEAA